MVEISASRACLLNVLFNKSDLSISVVHTVCGCFFRLNLFKARMTLTISVMFQNIVPLLTDQDGLLPEH